MSGRPCQRKPEPERRGYGRGISRLVSTSFNATERFGDNVVDDSDERIDVRAAFGLDVDPVSQERKISGTTGRQTHRHHQKHESPPH